MVKKGKYFLVPFWLAFTRNYSNFGAQLLAQFFLDILEVSQVVGITKSMLALTVRQTDAVGLQSPQILQYTKVFQDVAAAIGVQVSIGLVVSRGSVQPVLFATGSEWYHPGG